MAFNMGRRLIDKELNICGGPGAIPRSSGGIPEGSGSPGRGSQGEFNQDFQAEPGEKSQ